MNEEENFYNWFATLHQEDQRTWNENSKIREKLIENLNI